MAERSEESDLRVEIHDTADEAARAAAMAAAHVLRTRARPVLGLATGGTMEPVYRALIGMHRDGLSFAHARTFNLDEYVGLPPDHPQSYAAYMRRHLFDHVDLVPAHRNLPRGDIDPGRAAREYEARLAAAGRIDLQLLGLGRNGHIGFNEPGSAFGSRTRPVTLAPSTVAANARFFEAGAPPDRAVTMGIATILSARRIAVVASGAAKADAVRAMLQEPVTEAVPATALRGHGDVSVILDRAAASALSR